MWKQICNIRNKSDQLNFVYIKQEAKDKDKKLHGCIQKGIYA